MQPFGIQSPPIAHTCSDGKHVAIACCRCSAHRLAVALVNLSRWPGLAQPLFISNRRSQLRFLLRSLGVRGSCPYSNRRTSY